MYFDQKVRHPSLGMKKTKKVQIKTAKILKAMLMVNPVLVIDSEFSKDLLLKIEYVNKRKLYSSES